MINASNKNGPEKRGNRLSETKKTCSVWNRIPSNRLVAQVGSTLLPFHQLAELNLSTAHTPTTWRLQQ